MKLTEKLKSPKFLKFHQLSNAKFHEAILKCNKQLLHRITYKSPSLIPPFFNFPGSKGPHNYQKLDQNKTKFHHQKLERNFLFSKWQFYKWPGVKNTLIQISKYHFFILRKTHFWQNFGQNYVFFSPNFRFFWQKFPKFLGKSYDQKWKPLYFVRFVGP